MKCLNLVAPEPVRETLADLLISQGVDWFTVTLVEGHGPGLTSRHQSAHDEVMGFVGCIRFEILLEDDRVEAVLTGLVEGVGVQTRRLLRHWVTSAEPVELLRRMSHTGSKRGTP